MNAIGQRPAAAAHGHGRHLELRHRHQSLRVGRGVAGHLHRHIVAAQLPLDPKTVRDPPHCRVIEEQRLGHHLTDVDEVVVAADVRKLVSEYRIQLRGGQAHQRRGWEKDKGAKPANHARAVSATRGDNVHRSTKSHSCRQERDPFAQPVVGD